MTTRNFPDGTTQTSTAKLQGEVNVLMQSMMLNVLNLDPASDAQAYSKVRIGWITQPSFGRDEDICSIRCTESDGGFTTRDRKVDVNDSTTVKLIDTYIRVWSVAFTFYGPNGFDNARLLKSAVLMDWNHGQLADAGMYLVTEFKATTRAPELFEGQWWDRSDLTLFFNELVTETITAPSMASAEALLRSQLYGQQADITAQA